jgi:epoxide hydrolase 4
MARFTGSAAAAHEVTAAPGQGGPLLEHRFVRANGIRLHYVEAGAGPLVVLLHGFPDYWYSWRLQLPALASAGFRVVAPDLRGYNLSERPDGVGAYRLALLAGDVSALVHRLEGGAPVLVGHDWGGVIAWRLAMERPESLLGLAILNAPHPATFRRELRRPSSQVLRSLYAAFFQLPKIPEAMLSAREFALLKASLRRGPARTGAELREYLSVFSPPGALTAALNYYRAALRYPPPRPRRIRVPTLVLWGNRDPFLVPPLAEGLEPWIDDLEVVRLREAGHWLQLSHPEQVNRSLLSFVGRARS